MDFRELIPLAINGFQYSGDVVFGLQIADDALDRCEITARYLEAIILSGGLSQVWSGV